VQLLNSWALNVVLTALIVSGIISIAISLVAGRFSGDVKFGLLFLTTFAFSLLGFVTGEILGDSREAAVGTVIPAVLTLLGVLAAYFVTSKGLKAQSAAVSAILICFTLPLLIGTLFGIRLRVEYEYALQDPALLGQRDLALQQNKLAVEIQRLQDYVTLLQLRDSFAGSRKLVLSRFESTLEKVPRESKQEGGGDHAQTTQPQKSAGSEAGKH
jgi:hypothetical protein